ncbi:MAG: hypothetical protein V7750_16570 [Sneathiella sp.]
MKNPLQAMLEAGVVEATDFPPESRYHGLATRRITGPDGIEHPYLARRFVPDQAGFSTLRLHRVSQGERLDQIAAKEIGNPELFWMLCDANGVIWPEELEKLDQKIRITLPRGVLGAEEN